MDKMRPDLDNEKWTLGLNSLSEKEFVGQLL